MTATVRVPGLDRLERALNEFEAHLADPADPLAEAADQVARTAAALAPRRSGRLAASMTAHPDGTVSSPLAYWPVIHEGWPGHNIEPHPFAADALDRDTNRITDLFADYIDTGLSDVAGRY